MKYFFNVQWDYAEDGADQGHLFTDHEEAENVEEAIINFRKIYGYDRRIVSVEIVPKKLALAGMKLDTLDLYQKNEEVIRQRAIMGLKDGIEKYEK